mmetsp:Transcript_50185/g.98204  ORF Transcript_50185/g.98204 Transcript_50185/m.98204 type:complete len:306 (+) Transcript_50185:417-1334(+)
MKVAQILIFVLAIISAAAGNDVPNFTFATSVAATRALDSSSPAKPYHKPLAALFVGDEALEMKRKQMLASNKTVSHNQVSSVVARHMIIDKMLHEAVSLSDPHGPRQVVTLGAGFDSRANRFATHLPVNKWFEIDLPAPQMYKQQVLRKSGIVDPENLVRVPLDLNAGDFVKALEEAGWDPTAPTLYILEGLIYYFPTENVVALLKSIPCVPRSRIVVSVVERSLQRVFTAALGKDPYSTNYELLRSAGALRLKNYKLRQTFSTLLPNRFGLGVRVIRPSSGTWWRRLMYNFHIPCERVLEYEAI